MRLFKIETRNDTNGSWSTMLTFKPEYLMTIERKGWWSPREIGVIENLREAEEVAQEKALKFAKALRDVSHCRVMQEVEVDGCKTSDLLWQNGHHVDGTQHGLFGWLKGWLGG